jgi:hypothetical protein
VAAVGSVGAGARAYRTRHPMPALVLAVILATTAALVWLSVLHDSGASCPDPAPAAGLQRLSPSSLDGVAPWPPQFVRVQVLNANGVLGEAAIVDGQLAQLGFAPTTAPANDPLHPAFDLRCYGEIRFGAAGQAAARTLSLAVPCADLVRDHRPGSTVDLALGTRFSGVRPNEAARTALLSLAGLKTPVPAGPAQGGLAAAAPPEGPAPENAAQAGAPDGSSGLTHPALPAMNPDLLRQARQVRC